MTTLRPAPTRAGGSTAVDTRGGSPTPGLARRRSVPHLLLGAVLVVGCAVAFAGTALRVDPRTPVLAVAHDLPAGHVLTDSDLTVVRIVADADMATVAESRRSSVVGRSVRLPMAAGGLLAETMLGPGAWPPAGQSVVAVKVTAGHAPTDLVAGAQVLVLVVPTSSGNTASAAQSASVRADATVVSVERPDTSGARVVSLLMIDADAVRIAGAAGEASLVVRGRAG
ncbi:MAG: hypothetical protein HKP61_13385 [Dactylosporangium sp.]|nr:hypothetical protein [Dactylosporangium sp.]NNJ61908.1 hypothetical protein [Dactylosporangium sp.]